MMFLKSAKAVSWRNQFFFVKKPTVATPIWRGSTPDLKQVPPCRLCAFAVKIYASRNADHGRQCIWYGVRLPARELEQSTSDVRLHCLRDGNNFQWPLRGFTTEKLIELRMKMTDWYLQRSSTSVQRLANIVSLVLSGIAITVSVVSLFVRAGN